MTNLLQNGDFNSGEWTRQTHTGQEFGEICVPRGWTAFWREGLPVPHDPANTVGYARPEMKVIPKAPPYLSPPRIYAGQYAVLWFTFWKIHDCGIYQRVSVTPGESYQAAAMVHAWSAVNDDPYHSSIDGEGWRNFSFALGLDPTGGTEPFGAGVVWGPELHIYDAYSYLESPAVTAQSDHLTVFVRSFALWPFKHNDAYVDSVELMKVIPDSGDEDDDGSWNDGGDIQPPDPAPPPDLDYPYPVVAQGTKLYPHVIGEGGAYDILQYLHSNGFTLPFCKVLATDPSQLPAVANLRALSPETQFIVRLMRIPNSGLNIEGPDFSADPGVYMAAFLPLMTTHPEVAYWELWNEQDPINVVGHVQMANFAVGCMQIAQAHGIRLALMSYSTGVPEDYEWQAIINQTQFFETARAGGHILALHAYCHTGDPASIQFHLLRPLQLYDLLPPDKTIAYIFTEYNVPDGLGGWGTPQLMAEYAAVDALLSAQPFCLGATLFTFGLGWPQYNLNTRWRPLADLILATRGRVNAIY